MVVLTLISVLLNNLPSLLRVEVPRGDLGPAEGRVIVLDTPSCSMEGDLRGSSSMEGDLRGLSAGKGGGELLTLLDTTRGSVVKRLYYILCE